jgi:hypothetical protein
MQSREIVNIPSFKGKMGPGGKKSFDPDAEENRWRPGVIFWLEDPDTFEQMKNQPVDMRESMEEEQNDFRIASLIMGIDAFLSSGRPSPEDPSAPGNKTQLLIEQGNIRMEDPLSELRYGVEKVGEICVSHLYQFGSPMIDYKGMENQPQEDGTIKQVEVPKRISKRIFRSGLQMKMQAVSVVLNPENEFAKWMARHQALMVEPLYANRPESRVETIQRALRNGRVPGRDKILPSVEQVKAETQSQVQMALEEMLRQRQIEQQQAEQVMAQDKAKIIQGRKKQLLDNLKMKSEAAKFAKDLEAQRLSVAQVKK